MRHYVGVLRRRWRWIAAGLLLGMIGGLLSSYIGQSSTATGTFYKATNSVINDNTGASKVNLQQAAFLMQSADVQKAIATEVGSTVDAVRDRVAAVAKPDVSVIDVTAISTDPAEAARLANTSAEQLVVYVTEQEQEQYTKTRDATIAKLDALKAQRTDLEAQIAKNPSNVAILRAEVDSIVNQYRVTYEQLQALAKNGAPTSGFSTLNQAVPIQINARAYKDRLDAIVNSRGSAAAAPAKASYVETDLSVATPTSRASRVGIGGLIGLVIGLASAFIVEIWDDRLRRREKVELVTALPVIAEIPHLTRNERQDNAISVIDAPRSRASERYRTVRTTILFALDERLDDDAVDPASIESGVPSEAGLAPVILVTSPGPSEGKSTTTVNIASVFADSGARTLVVDCDYRRPSIGKYLRPTPDLGGEGRPVATRVPNLWFVPAPVVGGSPAEAIAILREKIESLRGSFDVVLLDTPPMLTTNDATDLLDAADHVVLVIRSGQTRSGPAERVASLLSRFRANVIGVVLNSCAVSDMDSYYGYYSYYGGSGARGYYGNPTPKKGEQQDAAGRHAAVTGPL